MRRNRHRFVRLLGPAFGACLFVVLAAGAAHAQTTPTTAVPTTTAPTTGTTAATSAQDDSGSDFPWIAVVIGVLVVAAIIAALAVWSRRRRKRNAAVAWRARAADATAQVGAMARQLSRGAPVTGEVAQEIVTSLGAFHELETSAPDRAARASAQRGRSLVQELGVAIDADHQLRRARPSVPPERLAGSDASLRATAAETDRALRALYRGFTETG